MENDSTYYLVECIIMRKLFQFMRYYDNWYVHNFPWSLLEQCVTWEPLVRGVNMGLRSHISHFSALWPWQNGHQFLNDLSKFKISLKFIPKGPINNIPALVQIMIIINYFLKQWWLVYWRIYASLGLSELLLTTQIILSAYTHINANQWCVLQRQDWYYGCI